MTSVMCLSCGAFSPAVEDEGTVSPLVDACGECGGTEFKHRSSGTYFEVGD